MIDGVHTCDELVKMKLAEPVAFSERGKGRKKEAVATKVRISDEGHALLGKQLREAAKRNGPLRGERLKALFDRPRGRVAHSEPPHPGRAHLRARRAHHHRRHRPHRRHVLKGQP